MRHVVLLSLGLLAAATLSCVSAPGVMTEAPYLQSLTDSSVVVCWEAATPRTGKVQYGLSAAYGQQVVAGDKACLHQVRLAGLLADTIYHYRVVTAGETSPDFAFHTPGPSAVRFRFAVYGDTRSDSAAHQSVADRMALAEPRPRLLIHVGDLTEDGTASQYQTFFGIERGLLSRAPLWPSVGNHDARSLGEWYRLFDLPNNERWYSFRYGNSAFHCIDNESVFAPASEQHRWLLRELQADSADPTVRHIFVFFHEPPYTTNQAHGPNLEVRQYLCPLFERYGVDVAFAGHVHAYEHSFVNGVHHITAGGGGAPLAPNWNVPDSWTIYREATLQFTVVDVAGDTVRCRSVRPDDTEFDAFEFVKPPRPAIR